MKTLAAILVEAGKNLVLDQLEIPKLAPGGFLVVDDVERWADRYELGIPPQWSLVDESTNGIKRSAICR